MRGNDLREEFSPYGEIVFARVNLDRETKRSKGFGFVEFANADDAAKAKAEMDWQELWGRPIKVDFAKEDPNRISRAAEAKEEGPSSVNVVLASCGANKIAVIKLIKEATGLGLGESKAIADNGGVIKENVSSDEANEMKAKFEEAGATIEFK